MEENNAKQREPVIAAPEKNLYGEELTGYGFISTINHRPGVVYTTYDGREIVVDVRVATLEETKSLHADFAYRGPVYRFVKSFEGHPRTRGFISTGFIHISNCDPSSFREEKMNSLRSLAYMGDEEKCGP